MSSKIASIETFLVHYQPIGYFKFLEGPKGAAPRRPTVVVKITSNDGVVGWGQSVPTHRWSYETPESVQTTIDHYLGPELLGADPFDEPAVQTVLDKLIAPSFSTGQPICKAGIDLALFDLTGKILGLTAAQRWKKEGRQKIQLSWTVNVRSLAEAEAVVMEGQSRGYSSFNLKVAPDPKYDVELCRLVKRLAPNAFIWADANAGYDEASALAVMPQLADLGLPALEQPLPANRLTGYQRLKKQGALPIIMDEGVVSLVDLEEFINLGVLDGVAMKVARCGGITHARRMIEMLQDRGLLFMGSGLTDPDISLAACLTLFGAYDLKYPAALNGPQYLQGTILNSSFEIVAGEVAVPDGPGLGVDVDTTKLFNRV
jgi:L-alanine-DL-glutamate epimerase-like enolase superfamily enzyme